MNHSFITSFFIKPLVLSLEIAVFGVLAQTARATNGNDTWLGNTDVNWATGANWSPAVNAPPIGGDSLIFGAAGSSGVSLNNNIAASTAVNALTFNSGASAFTFSGNAINLAGNITDNAANTETINFPMAMTGNRTCIITNGGNLVLGGVISGAFSFSAGNGANIGTVTLNGSAVNTYTGSTVAGGGTLLLDFANLASPVNLISSSSALSLAGGTLSVKGKSSGSTAQTLGNVAIAANLGSSILLNPNGGASTTLTLGNTWTRAANALSSMNIDLSAGGTLASVPSSAVNSVLGYATVKDATAVGLALLSGGNLIRLTGQTTLPVGATTATVNYITSGNVTRSVANFSVNSLTLDASAGTGVLNLGGASDVMTITSLGLLMFGANDYTITNGQVGAVGSEVIIHQMGTGKLTINGTVSSSTGRWAKNGPGTLVLGGANSAGVAVINQGTVQQGVANALGATTLAFTVNGGATMDLNGYNLGVGLVSSGYGVITNSGALASFTMGNGSAAMGLANNIVTGPINLIVNGGGALGLSAANTHTGGTTLTNNTGVANNYRVSATTAFGTGPLTFNGGGTLQQINGLTVTNAVVVNSTGNTWWLDAGTTYGSSGPWSGTGTINVIQTPSKSPTFTFSGDLSGFQGTLLLSANTNTTATVFTYALGGAATFDGSHATWDLYSLTGTFSSKPVLQWAGTGSQTIKLGDLTSAGTTGNGAIVVSNSVAGTTATFEVGNLNNNSTFAGTVVSGVGTTTALTKVGTGTWTLSGTNTYTGNTTISAGTLALSAPAGATSIISNSPVISVANGAIFNVSGMGSTFALGSSQTLSNNASGTGILNGSLNSGAGTISVSYASGTSALNVTNGTLTLSAGTVFKVNNTGSALAVGNYKIISKATAGNVGLVAGTVPTAVTVSGGGIVGGTGALLQINGGELELVVSLLSVSTTALTTSGSPSTYGGSVTFTATLQTNGVTAGNATSNYVFKVDGATVATYTVASGQAAYTTSALIAGSHIIAAEYAGDSSYTPSTNNLSQTVNQAPLTITANNTNKVYDGVVFTGGNGVTYSGFVNGETNTVLSGTLSYGGTSQGATNAGSYTIIPSGLTNTTYTNYNIGFANGTLTINQASTSVGVSSTNNPSGYLNAVSFIAALPSYATGDVVFSSTNAPISTNAVTAGSASSLSITNLPRGTNLITAIYSGDSNYLGSTNTLNQIVTNHPPVAVDATYYRAKGTSLKIALTNLLTNVTDVDGDTNTLQSVGSSGTGATILTDTNYVYYQPSTGVSSNSNDSFTYTVGDGFGGSATANILVNVYSAAGPAQISLPTNGVVNITFFGIPNYTYIVQMTTNLSVPWWTISTNTPGTNGYWLFTDPNATNNQQYYRLAQP